MYANISGVGEQFIIEVQIDDAADAYHDLAHIIIPMLKGLKAQSNGCPRGFVPSDHYWDGNGHEQLTFDFLSLDEEEAMGEEIFQKALDRMIWGFEQTLCYNYSLREPGPGYGDWYTYEEDVQAALRLFAEHFRSLWN